MGLAKKRNGVVQQREGKAKLTLPQPLRTCPSGFGSSLIRDQKFLPLTPPPRAVSKMRGAGGCKAPHDVRPLPLRAT